MRINEDEHIFRKLVREDGQYVEIDDLADYLEAVSFKVRDITAAVVIGVLASEIRGMKAEEN